MMAKETKEQFESELMDATVEILKAVVQQRVICLETSFGEDQRPLGYREKVFKFVVKP
jgi:hypothetical protein